MKNFPLVAVTILVIGLAGAATAQDKNAVCQNAIPRAVPFDDDIVNCKSKGTIFPGPSGGSPYRYDAQGSPQELLPAGYVTCNLTYYVCLDRFFKGKVINVNAGEKCPPSYEYESVQGREICCDKWEEAKRTKKPCDVMLDTDCDATPNSEDDFPTRAPANTVVDIIKSAGFIIITPPSGKAVGRQGPDESCSVTGHFLTGSKLIYRHVVLNKDTGEPDWYFAEVPGADPGWIPARDTTKPPPKPIDSGLKPGSIRAGPASAARGRPNTSRSNRRGTRRTPKRTSNRP